ncbi:hypothetical protein F7725_028994 [Dissostichus mawsoni]|uniref:Uncharacterized protein n=1 Tax=Dissostichus mawsoni TaxID=36200 RepID=A0A7J5XH72_DISMA|nr:hypothetical protein F7725_028994 [Dissostichus mawsoni]
METVPVLQLQHRASSLSRSQCSSSSLSTVGIHKHSSLFYDFSEEGVAKEGTHGQTAKHVRGIGCVMVVFARGVFLNFALDSDELRDCYSPGVLYHKNECESSSAANSSQPTRLLTVHMSARGPGLSVL